MAAGQTVVADGSETLESSQLVFTLSDKELGLEQPAAIKRR